jgi:hypothetical protein
MTASAKFATSRCFLGSVSSVTGTQLETQPDHRMSGLRGNRKSASVSSTSVFDPKGDIDRLRIFGALRQFGGITIVDAFISGFGQ